MTIYACPPWSWSYHQCPPDPGPGHCLCNPWPGERGVERKIEDWLERGGKSGEARVERGGKGLSSLRLPLQRTSFAYGSNPWRIQIFFSFFIIKVKRTVLKCPTHGSHIASLHFALCNIQKISAATGIFLGNWYYQLLKASIFPQVSINAELIPCERNTHWNGPIQICFCLA